MSALPEPPNGFVGVGKNDGVWYQRTDMSGWDRRWFMFGYEIPDTWEQVLASNPDGLIAVKITGGSDE